MKKYKVPNISTLFLLIIFVLALILRLWNIDGFGFPRIGSVNDEPYIADNALKLIKAAPLDFSQWKIGWAYVYLQVLFAKIIFYWHDVDPIIVPTFREFVGTHDMAGGIGINLAYPFPEYYRWSRAIVAIFGALSVMLVYFIGTEVKSRQVGLIAAYFLAVLPVHVEHSQYVTRAVPGAFFLLLAFYTILLAHRRAAWWLYGVGIGLAYLAIYTKQNNLIILAPLSLAMVLAGWRAWQQWPRQMFIRRAGGLLLGLTGLIAVSKLFFQFDALAYGVYLFNRIFNNAYVFGGQHFGNSADNSLHWLIGELFTAPSASWRLVSMFAVPGVLLALSLKDRGMLLLAVPLPYLLMMSLFTVRFEWWLIPPLAFLAVVAALSLEWIFKRIRQNPHFPPTLVNIVYGVLVFLIAAPALRMSVTLNYYAAQPDVRNTAGAWMEVHLPPNSKIIVDSWGPYVDDSRHEVTYVRHISDEALATYRENEVDYLVLNSINLSRIISAGADPRVADTVSLQKARLKEITETLPLVQKFTGPALFNPPVVDILIYRLP